jgi:hypothetical protein
MSTPDAQKTCHAALYRAWLILTECEDSFEFSERSPQRAVLTCAQRHIANAIMRLRALENHAIKQTGPLPGPLPGTLPGTLGR